MHAKRILSLALVFFMAFALLPAPADAADNAVHPAVDLSDESGISSNNLETIGRQRTEKGLAASDASTYYATDVQIPEGITNFALCDFLAPVRGDY